jgi:hypothetical protein
MAAALTLLFALVGSLAAAEVVLVESPRLCAAASGSTTSLAPFSLELCFDPGPAQPTWQQILIDAANTWSTVLVPGEPGLKPLALCVSVAVANHSSAWGAGATVTLQRHRSTSCTMYAGVSLHVVIDFSQMDEWAMRDAALNVMVCWVDSQTLSFHRRNVPLVPGRCSYCGWISFRRLIFESYLTLVVTHFTFLS